MTIDEIRRFQKREPFEPFELVLVDGRVFRVPHPGFILVPPVRGSWVYVAEEDGSVEHINTVVIGSVRHSRNGRGPRWKKAG